MKAPFNFLEEPSEKHPPNKWVFIFHGYGADAYDLRSLAEVLRWDDQTQWMFPQGPLSVPIGPGWTGRAWWPLRASDVEQGTRDPSAWLDHEPEGLPELRNKALQWISGFEPRWDRVVLGGFSQGSMLATDLFLHAPQTPAGLMIFSGSLINRKNWQAVAPQRKGGRFFQSHGKSDSILPFAGASRLEGFLKNAGLEGSLMSFEGTHEIPGSVIARANQFLESLPK